MGLRPSEIKIRSAVSRSDKEAVIDDKRERAVAVEGKKRDFEMRDTLRQFSFSETHV